MASFRNTFFHFLRKNKTFTAINIAGLAFGFTCAILILMHVCKENSYNTMLPDYQRVFNLVQKTPDSPLGNTTISYALTPLLASHFPEIEYFARTENFSSFSNCVVSYHPSGGTNVLSFNESSFCLADSNIFQIMQYPFIEGTRETALSSVNSIVISKETAHKYFGNETALGKTLVLNNNQDFTVSGVVDIPAYVTFNFSMLAPITALRPESKLQGWDSNGQPFFKLIKNTDYKALNKRIEHFYGEYKPEGIRNPEQLTLSFLPITERRLYYNKNPLYLLIFTGIVVLIISILNYVNLSTALIQKRTSEIALKKISGAGKKSIGSQFMYETATISFIAIVLGGMLAIVGLPIFKKLTGSDVGLFMHSHILLFISGSLTLWVAISLLAGFYPAVILSGVQPLTLFKKGRKSVTDIRNKNLLTTFQFIISIILVILTLMVNKQYHYMADLPLGFDNKMVMQVPLTNQLKSNYQNLKEELDKLPSVKSICAASSMPAGIPNHSGVTWTTDKGEKKEESFAFAIVSDGYTQTFGMKMSMGNEFVSERPEELKGVLINEAAARQLGFDNPIGKQINFWGKESTIVGVVKDFQNNYIFNQVKPMIMSAHPKNQGFTKFIYISIMPGDADQTIKSIEKTIKQISPEYPFEYSFTNEEVAEYIEEIRQINKTFSFASIISIALAIIGLIALTYHATQARIKEIGIRKVNGARSLEIITMLNSNLLKSIAIAFVVACPVGWAIIHKLLQGIANKTDITVWVFVWAGIMVSFVALLTVSMQSWKAATLNPSEALRYE